MKVGLHMITPKQEEAMVAAMNDTFTIWDVRAAAAHAGVESTERAADRLLQRERKANRIKHTGGGRWIKLGP